MPHFTVNIDLELCNNYKSCKLWNGLFSNGEKYHDAPELISNIKNTATDEPKQNTPQWHQITVTEWNEEDEIIWSGNGETFIERYSELA